MKKRRKTTEFSSASLKSTSEAIRKNSTSCLPQTSAIVKTNAPEHIVRSKSENQIKNRVHFRKFTKNDDDDNEDDNSDDLDDDDDSDDETNSVNDNKSSTNRKVSSVKASNSKKIRFKGINIDDLLVLDGRCCFSKCFQRLITLGPCLPNFMVLRKC